MKRKVPELDARGQWIISHRVPIVVKRQPLGYRLVLCGHKRRNYVRRQTND